MVLLLAVAAMTVSAGPANAGVTIVGGKTGGSSGNSSGFFVSNGFGGDIDFGGFHSGGGNLDFD